MVKESGHEARLEQPGVRFWHKKSGKCEIPADLGSLRVERRTFDEEIPADAVHADAVFLVQTRAGEPGNLAGYLDLADWGIVTILMSLLTELGAWLCYHCILKCVGGMIPPEPTDETTRMIPPTGAQLP